MGDEPEGMEYLDLPSDVSARELSEKTYRAIGHFIYEFSQTEYTIRFYLGKELKLSDEFFSAVIESYDVALLCNVCKKVTKISMHAERAANLEKSINQFLAMNGERTRVAHGLWVPFFKGGMVHHVSRNSLQSQMHEGQAELLEKHAGDLRGIRAELSKAFTGLDIDWSK